MAQYGTRFIRLDSLRHAWLSTAGRHDGSMRAGRVGGGHQGRARGSVGLPSNSRMLMHVKSADRKYIAWWLQQSRQGQIVVYVQDDRGRPDQGQQIRDLVLTIFEVSP